jgi:serine/threonine protein kinase
VLVNFALIDMAEEVKANLADKESRNCIHERLIVQYAIAAFLLEHRLEGDQHSQRDKYPYPITIRRGRGGGQGQFYRATFAYNGQSEPPSIGVKVEKKGHIGTGSLSTTAGSKGQLRPDEVNKAGPNVAKYLMDLAEDTFECQVWEWIHGADVETVISELERNKHLNERERAIMKFLLFLWMSRVVAGMHRRNLIHRDIKPDNFMKPRHRMTVLGIDFGVAQIDTVQLSEENTSGVSGSLPYMPPEQTVLTDHPSRSMDVYALGGILDQLLSADGDPLNVKVFCDEFNMPVRGEPEEKRLQDIAKKRIAIVTALRDLASQVEESPDDVPTKYAAEFEAAALNVERLVTTERVPEALRGLSTLLTQIAAPSPKNRLSSEELVQQLEVIEKQLKDTDLVLAELNLAAIAVAASRSAGEEFCDEYWGTYGTLRLDKDGHVILNMRSVDGAISASSSDVPDSAWEQVEILKQARAAGITIHGNHEFEHFLSVVDRYRELYLHNDPNPADPVEQRREISNAKTVRLR